MEWVVTDNVERETWRRLRQYANPDFAMSRLAAYHGPPSKKQRANYKKQTRQLRAAIIQAQEFFEAARDTTLYTSPNHLYYGIVSLASAIMLLRGDGTKSMDVLRADPKNKHHGLSLTVGVTASKSVEGLTLLAQTRVTIEKSGHFFNWYETMPRYEEAYGVRETVVDQATLTEYRPLAIEPFAPVSLLVGQSTTALAAVAFLPDISKDLLRLGVPLICARMNVSEQVRPGDHIALTKFHLHPTISQSALDRILDCFSFAGSTVSKVTHKVVGNAAIIEVPRFLEGHPSFELPGEEAKFRYPSARTTSFGEDIVYPTDIPRPELADLYMAAYSLSMLARYWPDYWVSFLESHCLGAQTAEAFVSTYIRKAPILTLCALANQKVVISTERAPWL